MKQISYLIIAIALLTLLSSCSSKHGQQSSVADSTAVVSSESYYTCPMHPFVRSDRPGACPVCGMALVKKTGSEKLTENQTRLLKDVSLSPSQMVLANVETIAARRGTFEKEITAVGVVSVAEPLQATIAARFSGRVEKLYADYTGFIVKKGQPLFELYSPEIISAVQDYLLALGGLPPGADSDRQDQSSMERLAAASRTRLQNHFGMTDEQIRQLQKTRKPFTSLRFDSPIHGTVLTKNVQEGQYVDEGLVLYQLADLSKVWIYLDIYEQNLSFVHVGESVKLSTDAYPGEIFQGRVTFIDPTLNSETRTIRVRTEFANPDFTLKPNMYVEAHITVPVTDALVIPTSAILQTGTRSVVWVETRENTFEPRTVVVGTSTDNKSEILDGIREGEIVAASGGFLIDSESQLSSSSGSDVTSSHAGDAQTHGPGEDVMAQPSKVERSEQTSKRVADINVLVHGSYKPDVIHATLGETLRLHFFRDEDSECTSEVEFKDFNIRRFLPPHDTTTITITPTKAGTIAFECGENMVHGEIIVSK